MSDQTKLESAPAALERAVAWAGNRTRLAVEMRVSERTIDQWLALGRVPRGPSARLLALLLAGGTELGAEELERVLLGGEE